MNPNTKLLHVESIDSPRTGCYLYCFALAQPYSTREELRGPAVHPPQGSRATHGSPLSPLTTDHSPLTTHSPPTVDPRYGLRVVWYGDIAAIWSPVGFDRFGIEKFQPGTADPQTIAAAAVRHDEVIASVMRTAPVLPLRLCTLFEREQNIASFLADHVQAVYEFLRKVEHKEEWGLKLFRACTASTLGCSPAEHRSRHTFTADCLDDTWGGESRRAGTAGPGVRYFQHKRRQRERREQAHANTACHASEIVTILRRFTVDIQPLPVRQQGTGGRGNKLVWNAACLVDHNRSSELRCQLATLAESFAVEGFTLELTGPWAPYNFCPPLATTRGVVGRYTGQA